jgi:hypothetical protein
MPERTNNFNGKNNNFNEELNAFLRNLSKESNRELIRRESLRRSSKSSFLIKFIKNWIEKGKIKENETVSDLLSICEREKSIQPKTITLKQWRNFKREINAIIDQIHWFQNEITSENLSIKELIGWLELIIKEEENFRSNSLNNLN